MAVVEDDWGKTWDRVVKVSDAELRTGLAGHKVGIHVVANTRRSKCVDINCEALSAEDRSGKSSDGTTERMSRGDDFEGRVGGTGLGESVCGSAGDFIPGVVEAIVDFTAIGE